MVAKETKPANATNTAPASDFGADIDWGEDVAEPDIDGWWKEELQKEVAIQITGFKVIETEHSPADVVIGKLLAPAKVVSDKGEEKELPVGAAIGIFAKAKLAPLLEYVEFKNKVKVTALEKVKIKGGKTMWKYKITPAKGAKVGSPPSNSVRVKVKGTVEEPDTDFP